MLRTILQHGGKNARKKTKHPKKKLGAGDRVRATSQLSGACVRSAPSVANHATTYLALAPSLAAVLPEQSERGLHALQ